MWGDDTIDLSCVSRPLPAHSLRAAEGQVCCASSRIYVHEKIYDAFVAASVSRAKARTVGDGFSGAAQGPQVDNDQLTKILGLIDTGKTEGAKLECGGKRHGIVGFFVEPTIFSDVSAPAAVTAAFADGGSSDAMVAAIGRAISLPP